MCQLKMATRFWHSPCWEAKFIPVPLNVDWSDSIDQYRMVDIMCGLTQGFYLWEDWRLPPWALGALSYHALSPIDYPAEETTQKGLTDYLWRKGPQWNQAFQQTLKNLQTQEWNWLDSSTPEQYPREYHRDASVTPSFQIPDPQKRGLIKLWLFYSVKYQFSFCTQ